MNKLVINSASARIHRPSDLHQSDINSMSSTPRATSNDQQNTSSPSFVNLKSENSFITNREEMKRLYEAKKKQRKSYRSDPDRMWKLREKFIEQSKKYLGTPYAKKYFSRDSPSYHSKLFLDCCGLVRKVMRDLEEDFGFRIGNGNQAYQFDTLPGQIEDLKDVKPGDLVFMTGIYYTDRLKKQPHNCTHVEIMLGDGSEATIGSRWNNGHVSIFPSYKFTSKSFHSEKYYIKSIDPWLWGYCKSYCPRHAWNYNTELVLKKKSSLYIEQERAYKAKLKLEIAASNDRKSSLGQNKPEKKKKRIKKIKKKVKKPLVVQKPQQEHNKADTTNQQTSVMSHVSSTTSPNNNQDEEDNSSEYEFHSESEFDENDFENAEDSNSCINDAEESLEEEAEDAEAELEGVQCMPFVLSAREFRCNSGASNCAEINSDFSQFDYSSLSDTFYYENFVPSKSGKITSTGYKQENSSVAKEFNDRSSRRDDQDHDDDDDIQSMNKCINLLMISRK